MKLMAGLQWRPFGLLPRHSLSRGRHEDGHWHPLQPRLCCRTRFDDQSQKMMRLNLVSVHNLNHWVFDKKLKKALKREKKFSNNVDFIISITVCKLKFCNDLQFFLTRCPTKASSTWKTKTHSFFRNTWNIWKKLQIFKKAAIFS